MSSRPITDKSPKPKNGSPLRTALTTPTIIAEGSSSQTPAEALGFILFSVLSSGRSDDGDQVDIHFSDGHRFTFPTWWLQLCRMEEGLPSPEAGFCKNPSEIRVHRVKVIGTGIWATVAITWNTGTTSQFPALWLRVLGPRKALERERCLPRLPTPVGKNPRSGVEQLTLVEQNVRDGYRMGLIEVMEQFMEEAWLLDMPTSLLREMVKYTELYLQSEAVTTQASAAEASENDAIAGSDDEESLIDEGTSW